MLLYIVYFITQCILHVYYVWFGVWLFVVGGCVAVQRCKRW